MNLQLFSLRLFQRFLTFSSVFQVYVNTGALNKSSECISFHNQIYYESPKYLTRKASMSRLVYTGSSCIHLQIYKVYLVHSLHSCTSMHIVYKDTQQHQALFL